MAQRLRGVLRCAVLLALLAVSGCGVAHAPSSQAQSDVATAPASRAQCRAASVPGPTDSMQDMVRIPGGVVRMGSDDHEPEERPRRSASVQPFWMSRTEVTNAMFARFVSATQYVTLAERGLDAARYPTLPAEQRVAGGIVFVQPTAVRDLVDIGQWWRFLAGADWRHPDGPASSIVGRAAEPVVQIAYEDALAYAQWRGHALPTEAEWERAARGGMADAPFVWGDEISPDGRAMANIWEGVFPIANSAADGHAGRAPVGCYPANGYGLHDMAGNVWEWTRDIYTDDSDAVNTRTGPGAGTAAGPAAAQGYVIKGGSYLCAPNYCARYRPAARQPGDATTGTSHIGFRTVLRGRPA